MEGATPLTGLSNPVYLVLVMLVLAAAPFAAMMVTSYTKIVIVLSLLRNALGIQQVPPGIVLNGLAMVLSVYVMYPVCLAALDAGRATLEQQVDMPMARATPELPGAPAPVLPFSQLLQAVQGGQAPLKAFLKKHAHPREAQFFLSSSSLVMGAEVAASLTADDFIILVPSFVASELTAAFEIGFLIFLPFLVIDMLVAAVLMALGMQMVSPNTIALPFKLLLLVMLDGWARLLHALVLTYR